MNFKSGLAAAVLCAFCGLALTACNPGWPFYHDDYDKEYMDNAFPGVERIAILPFENYTTTSRKKFTVDIEDTIAAELTRYKDINIVRAATVKKYMKDNRIVINDGEDLLELGKKLNADLIIAAAITEYYPYNPPRIGLAVQVYSLAEVETHSLYDIERLTYSGIPYSVPGTIGSEHAPVLEMELLLDASLDSTKLDLRDYAKYRDTADNAFTDYTSCLNIIPHYARYYSDRLVRKIIDSRNERLGRYLAEDEQRKLAEAAGTTRYEKDAYREYFDMADAEER